MKRPSDLFPQPPFFLNMGEGDEGIREDFGEGGRVPKVESGGGEEGLSLVV